MQLNNDNAAPPAPATRPRPRPTGIPYSHELAWFIGEAPAALGAKGTLGSTVASLERGGGQSYPEPRLPGGPGYREGDGARYRLLEARWRKLDAATRGCLLAHYSAPPREPRVKSPGHAGGQPVGSALEVHVGHVAGAVALVAVTAAGNDRRRRARAALDKAMAELSDCRSAAADAVPHIVADLDDIRARLVASLHGEVPEGPALARLGAIRAFRETLCLPGAAEAAARYSASLVAVADAQALLEDGPIATDWWPLVKLLDQAASNKRDLEIQAKRQLGVWRRKAIERVQDAHAAWELT